MSPCHHMRMLFTFISEFIKFIFFAGGINMINKPRAVPGAATDPPALPQPRDNMIRTGSRGPHSGTLPLIVMHANPLQPTKHNDRI